MLFTPFTFRNNVTAKNRFFKSAMEEDLSHHSKVSGELIKLYDTWAKGGTGILVTGNVMVSKSGQTAQFVDFTVASIGNGNLAKW